MQFTNIFSKSVAYLVILSTVSLKKQNFLVWGSSIYQLTSIKSICKNFMDHVFDVISKKSLLYGTQIFTPVLRSRGFIV